MKTKPKRLGLFGGTFNPIHYGHLRSAEEVAEALNLRRILFIPAALPPHKAPVGVTPFEVRLTMTRLAVGRHPRLAVSDVEGRRPGKSYSIDTLRYFREELGPQGELYFILGLDAVLEISSWKDYRELFTLSHFVVLDRPGYDRGQLGELLRRQVHPGFKPLADGRGFQHPQGCQVLFQSTTLLDISATRIRQSVQQERSIRYLLPERVRRFILKNRLYKAR
uniref:Probable nicotinate-nucleotide adenylyltransferase n=1 Tax=Desulfobacca acetoxidans TaxID=60893 RepID=A0A7C3Z6K8_9BACT